jgi:hypothetical protein
MRWHILRTLLLKEMLRHRANRASLTLLVLLLGAGLFLAFFHSGKGLAGGLASGLSRCYVDYWKTGPLLRHLQDHVPDDLGERIVFRDVREAQTNGQGQIVYPENTGAIQIRQGLDNPSPGRLQVLFWHPGTDRAALAPFEAWFWKEALYYQQARSTGPGPSTAAGDFPIAIESESLGLHGGLDPRAGLATALVLFGVFFICVYLMPALACEERERGVLLAQALTCARPREILAARFLFYLALAGGLGVTLAAAYQPRVLTNAFFWLALLVITLGALGIGLTVASLARTQRGASAGAMAYTLAVALVLVLCRQNQVAWLPEAVLEHHSPRLMHAALTGSVEWWHWGQLLGTAGLAFLWAGLAGILFRRRGWQ